MTDPNAASVTRTLRLKALQYGIPEYMVEGIFNWIVHHVRPGDFLSAVIVNDLRGACAHADDTNRHLLWEYCNFFYNEAPSPCWGSLEKARAWEEVGSVNDEWGEKSY